MKTTPRRAALILAALAFSTAAQAGPSGKWRVGDGSAVIAVRDCGSGLCGSIASIPERGATDENNPNPAHRARLLVGLPILNMQKAGENQWSGTIYNAKDGQSYSAKLTQNSESAVTLEGCVQDTNVCGQDKWTRVR